MTRAPVNRRDPSGTARLERAEIARQRALLRAYGEAMATVVTGDYDDKTGKLARLSDTLADDLASATDEWMAKAEEASVRTSDRVLNNLHTGIQLGGISVPREEVELLRAGIQQNVRSIAGDLLRDVERIAADGYTAGWSVDQTVRAINQATDGQVARAETIVRTETLRVADVCHKAAWDAAGCDGYLSYPTDDDRLCSKCLALATGGSGSSLKVYALDEPMALPWHPNCRCIRLPHFPDMEAIKI